MNRIEEAARHTILVVDDDEQLRCVISTNLELAGYNVELSTDGEDALARVEDALPDLILLDVRMPLLDGFATSRRLRSHPNPTVASVPIVMLTARGEPEDKVLGFDAGADDYITKPFGPAELLARVRARIVRHESDSSLSPLTRLPGNISIEAELRRRIAGEKPFAVLYLDLDNFKAFNDVYGFGRGDDAIVMLASISLDAVRRRGNPGDLLGHIGGDDFVILTTDERCDEIAKVILEEFDERVGSLYSENDRRVGFVETHDRRGEPVRVPLMSVSIAALSNEHRKLTDYGQIGLIAAELKSYAKSIEGSAYVKDKRRT